MSDKLKEPGDRYIHIVKDRLQLLGSDMVAEDLDLLCKYIVVRFLKTSPLVSEVSSIEEVSRELSKFVESTYSFIVTFIHIVNSAPLAATNMPEA